MYKITYLGENIIEGGIAHINFIKEVLRIKDFNGKDGVYQNDLQQEILITEVKKWELVLLKKSMTLKRSLTVKR